MDNPIDPNLPPVLQPDAPLQDSAQPAAPQAAQQPAGPQVPVQNPVQPQPAVQPSPVGQPAQAPVATAAPTGGQKKLLIVEDDKDTREIYEEVLKDAGYDVTTAVDGEDGLGKATQGGFALILLDVMMPKIDGLGFLREIAAKNLASKNGPIILFTNLSHDPVIKEGLNLGAKSFLVKSEFNPDQVVEKIKGFLQ